MSAADDYLANLVTRYNSGLVPDWGKPAFKAAITFTESMIHIQNTAGSTSEELDTVSQGILQMAKGEEMSHEYRVLYRHMKIETPDAKTYDCWFDGRTNTATFQQMDDYGLVGPTETIKADELEKRFSTGIVTVIASISTDARGMQFAGFARLLNKEINDLAFSYTKETFGTKILNEQIEARIARRAYDFAQHVIDSCDDQESAMGLDPHGMTGDALLAGTPDLTEWPEEQ